MIAETLAAPPRPIRKTAPPSATAFALGVWLSQVANNALHLAQPLLMAELTGSLGKSALFSSFDTAVHMTGTFMAGWPADRLGPRRLLILSTAARAASLAAIPIFLISGRLTPLAAAVAYTLDAFVRGAVDTASHALPLSLAGAERAELDRLNASYEFAFDCGGVVGPMILGALMLGAKGWAPHAFVAAGFAVAAAAFVLVPRESLRPSRKEGGGWAGARVILTDSRLLWTCAGLALLNLFPLRKLMSAFFAKAVLHDKAAAGWIAAAFGLGGALGSLFYGWRGKTGSQSAWIAAGAAGTVALAAGLLPSALWPMLAAAFLFALANVGARLAVTRRLQEATPLESLGRVTAAARFASNGASVLLKSGLAAAFAFGASPSQAFAAVAASLAVLAVLQAGLAARLKNGRPQ